jgi:hypothetical protein
VVAVVAVTPTAAAAISPPVNPYFVFPPLPFGDAAGCVNVLSHFAQPPVDITMTPSGMGCWLVAADGGVFSFGDAGFFGSAVGFGSAEQPIAAIAASPEGGGYWLLPSIPAVRRGVPAFSGLSLAKQEWQ